MAPIYAFTTLLVIYTASELLSKKTRALFSTVLAVAILMLAGFWSGILPKNIFHLTGIDTFGMLVVGLLLTSLGTTVDFAELKRQWKVVIVALLGALGGCLLILACGFLFSLRTYAIAGAPIFVGGSAATLIMLSALKSLSLPAVATFCISLLVFQKFIGIPIASYFLRKEAVAFRSDPQRIEQALTEAGDQPNQPARKKPLAMPTTEQTPAVYLTKLALVSSVAFFLAQLTHGKVNYLVVCFICGIIAYALGFLEKGILGKAKSNGLLMFLVTIVIFSNLAQTTPHQAISTLLPLLLFTLIGAAGVIIISFLLGRLFGFSPALAISLGISCTFGFPTTMILSQEVASSIGQTDAERQALESHLLPKMLTAGLVTVTIASVILAGIAVNYLA